MESPWVMMLAGLVMHLLFKLMKAKDSTKRNEQSWQWSLFIRHYVAPLVFSVIASFIFTGISIERGWPIWAAFFMSYASSSACYNIFPVITNPKLWQSLAGRVVGAVAEKQNPGDETH